MTVTSLGSLSVGAAIPGATLAIDAGIGGITPTLDELTARLSALGDFNPVTLPLPAQLLLAESFAASITAAIGLGIVAPDISAQIAIVAAQVAALIAQLAAIQAQLDLLIALQSPLAVAGIDAYAFAGPRDQFGSELSAAIGAGGTAAHGLALVTASGAAWTALSTFLKVAP